jgi:hypothetical protein
MAKLLQRLRPLSLPLRRSSRPSSRVDDSSVHRFARGRAVLARLQRVGVVVVAAAGRRLQVLPVAMAGVLVGTHRRSSCVDDGVQRVPCGVAIA